MMTVKTLRLSAEKSNFVLLEIVHGNGHELYNYYLTSFPVHIMIIYHLSYLGLLFLDYNIIFLFILVYSCMVHTSNSEVVCPVQCVFCCSGKESYRIIIM